jgi:hypothetical protein
MAKRKTGWPFQEGFIIDGTQEIHVFTDYRWNDGFVSRRQLVAPDSYDVTLVIVRPVSLKISDCDDQ